MEGDRDNTFSSAKIKVIFPLFERKPVEISGLYIGVWDPVSQGSDSSAICLY